MPVLTPPPSTAYDTVNTVLLAARARLNDEIKTLQPVSGKVLQNSQVYSQQATNNAWRKVQDYMAERGYARLINEVIIGGLPVVASQDPATQTWLGWSGCFDGANFFPSPALPADFTHPIKIWERWSNQNAEFGGRPMEKVLDGLPAVAKTTSIRYWEWRGDTIYMPGSQRVQDLRIRYVNSLPDFVDVGTVPWFSQPVPIMRISDGFSLFICAELAAAKEEYDIAERLTSKGEAALSRVFNLDVRADQHVNIQRRARSSRGHRGYW